MSLEKEKLQNVMSGEDKRMKKVKNEASDNSEAFVDDLNPIKMCKLAFIYKIIKL